MGSIDKSVLHAEHIARLLSPEERKRSGVKTALEAQHRYARQQERKMHDEFEKWLVHHEHHIAYEHYRMDKPTTGRRGWPDFSLFSKSGRPGVGLAILIEFKVPGNTLSADQKEVHDWLLKVGCKPAICFSAQDAIDIVRAAFFL